MAKIERILVPVDFSRGAKAAMEHAIPVAERVGARIDVLHVWQPPPYVVPEMVVTVPGGSSLPFDDFMKSRTSKDLQAFLEPFQQATPVAIAGHVESGTPRDVILEYAQSNGVDLVVMGTHGHRGLMHLLMGSVAEGIVRAAPCPVMTIRYPKGEEEEG